MKALLILAWAAAAVVFALEVYGYRKLRRMHAFMRNSLRLKQAEASALQEDDGQRMALLRRQVELSFCSIRSIPTSFTTRSTASAAGR